MCIICCWVWGYFWTVIPKFPRLTLYKHNSREQGWLIINIMKATCFKSETTVSNDFPPFVCYCLLWNILSFHFHSCLFRNIPFIIIQITCQSTFLPSPAMVLDNSNSPYHIEEELWLQILSLSRELQECKASLHHNTLDCISDKIEGIERELDVLLDILQGRQDKKTS